MARRARRNHTPASKAKMALAAMGRRTDIRLARAMPQIGQGLRNDHRQRNGVGSGRAHPNRHAPPRKSLILLMSFSVRL
jgi:hypothetical protein